jgi:hypothetical protein
VLQGLGEKNGIRVRVRSGHVSSECVERYGGEVKGRYVMSLGKLSHAKRSSGTADYLPYYST